MMLLFSYSFNGKGLFLFGFVVYGFLFVLYAFCEKYYFEHTQGNSNN